MEGLERFGAALRRLFREDEFTVEDIVCDLPREDWPPAVLSCHRMRGRNSSIGKALSQTPGAAIVPCPSKRHRKWRMAPYGE